MKIGIYKRVIAESTVADSCQVCGRVTEQKVQVLQEFFVLGFPLFPSGKTAKSICTVCKTETPVLSMPTYARRKYDELAATAKTPAWIFAFPIAMGILLAVMLIKAPFDTKRMNEMIDNPKVGDIYHYDYDDHGAILHNQTYTLWKVVGSSSKSIYVVKSIYEVTKSSEVSGLKTDDNSWDNDTVSYGKDWLKEQTAFTSDRYKISDIDRK